MNTHKNKNYQRKQDMKPKKLAIILEDANGKPLNPPLDDTDRLLILQAIQFNNVGAPDDQFAKMFQTDAATIKADIEHLKQLQARVRLRFCEVKDDVQKS